MVKNLLQDLNPSQQKAVLHTEGPVLILAGAGSGKTRVLTYRVAYLIQEKGVDPANILMVTFTNKAAGEMKERIRKLLAQKKNIPLPFAGTFHSLSARILRRHPGSLGFSPHFQIYDENDSLQVIKKVMANLNLSEKEYHPQAIKHLISEAKNELIDEFEYPQYARSSWQKATSQVYQQYQRLLKKYQAMDFDDLLFKVVRLFQREARILSDYQNHFQYILVDEYQDTNLAQYELTRLLAGRWHNLCVVGDCSQSIYLWRGANFHNIFNLKNDFPELYTFRLEQNYRSTQKILDAATKVIKKNTSHPVLSLWTKNQSGEKIKIYEAQNERDEANFIIQVIKKEENNSKKANKTAVLYRTNAQSRIIEEACLHQGIPYVLVGGTKFYARQEIKDLLAYLRALLNPQDQVSLERIKKIGKRRLTDFQKTTSKVNPAKESTVDILDKILSATHYLDLFDSRDESDLSRLENIKELRSVALEFVNLSEFLENVALIQHESLPQNSAFFKKKEGNNFLSLMTLHAAKGLEFETVFLIGMEEGLFPHSRSMLDKEELEEERRLCYVGMTRAKQNLYLTYALRRLYFGRRVSNLLSRFIIDIPQELLEFSSHDKINL